MCLAAIYWARLDRLTFANGRQDAAAIGFDDEFLYREIPLPLAERSIPTSQSLRDEALAVFTAWAEHPDKVAY
jgi:tRNA(Arg) A34 adenosine deaminase TadA